MRVHSTELKKEVRVMAEARIARTENPKYEVVPFLGPDFLRTNMFGADPFALMRRFADTAWHPAIDVRREKGKLLVHAELPGLKKEDVRVAITGDLLEIEGERKLETEERRNGYVHAERNYGKFYRAIALPERANAEKASAEFTDGVLTIAIPIPEVNRTAKEIPVGEVKARAELKH
jgi:HSP20 family molecular chaperone IbpA